MTLNKIQLRNSVEAYLELNMGVSLIPIITYRRGVKRVEELRRLQVSFGISCDGAHRVEM